MRYATGISRSQPIGRRVLCSTAVDRQFSRIYESETTKEPRHLLEELCRKNVFFFSSFLAYIFFKSILLGNFHSPRAKIQWAKARQHRLFVSLFGFEMAAVPFEELQEVEVEGHSKRFFCRLLLQGVGPYTNFFKTLTRTDVPPSQPDGNLLQSAASHSIGIEASFTNLKQKATTTSADEVMLKKHDFFCRFF